MSSSQKENLIISTPDNLEKGSASQYPKSQSHEILSSEPLWKRVPTRDKSGRPYSDFMMLIPGLRNFAPAYLREVIHKLESVLKKYEQDIVLADLNLKLNVLWVTVQPHNGITTEIAALIHHVIPEARLVAQHHE